MKSQHTIYFSKSQEMSQINDNSVDLVITSPPYPMIEMWDKIMSSQNPLIKKAFNESQPELAFELMHKELDAVWKECYRVVKDGGFICINIGDATRTIDGEFRLYNNHSRITQYCTSLGLTNLPNIIWRKQTNAPNKFMGSGMLPCGAYITLEHEYILIFRKGSKRNYKNAEQKADRRESSYFWEERNVWFSDLWDLKGTKQKIANTSTRDRSAAYPFEIPYRLINMYSQRGDVVLDPFLGTGTTTQAAMLLGRDSIGYEIDENMLQVIQSNIKSMSVEDMNKIIKARFDKHIEFVEERTKTKGGLRYTNEHLNCSVMTAQELDIRFNYVHSINQLHNSPVLFEATYKPLHPNTPLSGMLF
ncbi:MAG: site-specific DNA-methyltransferase [Alistipes sp.]|nr:site-specific DNA-methyltransferase [Alistipes sp.]